MSANVDVSEMSSLYERSSKPKPHDSDLAGSLFVQVLIDSLSIVLSVFTYIH
jgi:hypothetical protein